MQTLQQFCRDPLYFCKASISQKANILSVTTRYGKLFIPVALIESQRKGSKLCLAGPEQGA